MTISEEELNAKQLRAAHLRREISSLRTEGTGIRVEAEREITNRALDEEIARLEAQVVEAAKSAGGTVEDAIAAMERAAEVEQMARPKRDDDESKTDTSKVDTGATEAPVSAAEQPLVEDRPALDERAEPHDPDEPLVVHQPILGGDNADKNEGEGSR